MEEAAKVAQHAAQRAGASEVQMGWDNSWRHFGIHPPKTNMTLENPHVQEEMISNI